jgi:hypothetical protein
VLVPAVAAAGSTTIDLEDRLFHKAWQGLGRVGVKQQEGRYPPKPVERRDLWSPTSTTPKARVCLHPSHVSGHCGSASHSLTTHARVQGALELWVDILTVDEAKKYPRVCA